MKKEGIFSLLFSLFFFLSLIGLIVDRRLFLIVPPTIEGIKRDWIKKELEFGNVEVNFEGVEI